MALGKFPKPMGFEPRIVRFVHSTEQARLSGFWQDNSCVEMKKPPRGRLNQRGPDGGLTELF